MRKTFWGGFVDGSLCWEVVDDGWGGFGEGRRSWRPCVFRTRREARKCFHDVRKVIISEVRP